MIWFNCTHLQHQQAAISTQHTHSYTPRVCVSRHTWKPKASCLAVFLSVIVILDLTDCSNYLTHLQAEKIIDFHISFRNMMLVNYRNMNVFCM